LEKGWSFMVPPLDIFKIDGGNALWREAVESFEAAKACIQKLARSSPGEYLIFDQHTGNRVSVTPSSQDGPTDTLATE
jgi:hypothetical protein